MIVLFFALYGLVLFGQEKDVKKPEQVIIANNEIITKEKLVEYGEQGSIKAMNKGVTQDERNKLAEKFGDKIGDREFIIRVDLLKEQEKLKRKIETKPSSTNESKKRENELKLNIDDFAIDFTVQMINGEKITLSDLKGKVVLVNYWATWRSNCLKEFAEIPEKILEPFEDRDFVFIPISIGENKEKVQRKISKMKENGIDFNAGIDPTKKIWNQYATGGIPKNFVIDKNGIVKYISIGISEGNIDKLATEIKKLLAE